MFIISVFLRDPDFHFSVFPDFLALFNREAFGFGASVLPHIVAMTPEAVPVTGSSVVPEKGKKNGVRADHFPDGRFPEKTDERSLSEDRAK